MSRHRPRHRLLFAASLSGLLGAESAAGATFTAGSAGELLAAVASANATPGTDRIVLTADVTLDAVSDGTWGPSGLPNVTTPIVVEGRGFAIRRDPAAPQFRIFTVSGGFAGSGDLTLDDVTVEGGDVTGGLDQVLNGGGGVLNFLGRVELRNGATFADNAAYSGGAIGNRGDLVAADSHFAGNRATLGGALSSVVTGGPTAADLRRCVFDDNEANQSGGAIYNSATATIVDAAFTANRVTGASSFGGGGAIYNTTIQGDVTVARSSFSGNSASRGGALANYNASDMTLLGCDVRDNETLPGGHGGGIWNTNNAALVVRDSRIEDNEAVGFGDGGGVHNGGPNSALTLEGSSVRGNVAGNDGGGIFAQSSNITVISRIENSAIENNTAGGDGGGLYKAGASPLTVAASSIANNQANGLNGAGVACVGGDLRIADSVIAGNEGDSGLDGAGISNENAGTVLLERSTVSGNVTTGIGGISGLGGGIYNNQTGSTVTVRSSTISGNGAHYGGGVYAVNNAVTTLASSTITANVATANSGGIHALTGLTLAGSVLANNVAGTISPSSGNNCGGLPGAYSDGGGNFTDERGTICPVTFNESAAIVLQQLADNGGRTPTHALGAGSVAINGGGACGLATDQRGVPRTGACDAGAFEAGPVLPTLALGAATITVAEESGATVQAGMRLDNTAGTLAGGTVTAFVSLSGTAADGIDYTVGTPLPLLLAVPAPGALLNQSIAFTVQDDDVVEGTENIVLTLSLAGPARLTQTTREIRIIEGEVAAFLQYSAKQSKSDAQSGAGKLPPDFVVSLDDPSFPAFSSDGTTTEHYLVQKPTGLALPGDDGVTPADLDGIHLLAYQIREAKQGVSDVLTSGGAFAKALRHPARTNVRVRNRFGDIVLDTTKVAALLVPAAKSTLGPVAPPAAGADGVPHFKCFQVKATTSFDPAFEFGSQQDVRRRGRFLPVQATVLDQFADGAAHPIFGDARHYDLKKPRLYCNPAVLDAIDTATLDGAGNPRKTTAVIAGPSTVLDPARTLLCYQAKTATRSDGAAIVPRQQKHARRTEASGSALDVATQIVAPRLLDSRVEDLLCVPSTLIDDGCAGTSGACTGP